jgi:hypothetical protein
VRLQADRIEQLVPLGRRHVTARDLARREDGRDRRAQVVADGAEHGGLGYVLASEPPLSCCERAHAHGRDEIHGERHPVLRVVQLKRVRRRKEEPVESEHAHDGHGHRVAESPEGGDRQHGEEVEHAEAEHRRHRLERVDAEADQCDRSEAEDDTHRSSSVRPRALKNL